MNDTFNNYNIEMIPIRIKELRTLRYKQYSNSLKNDFYYTEEEKSYYSRFSFCKTQNSFAKELNANRVTVSSWENGTYIPSIDNLIIICKKLDCSLDYLLGSVDTPEIAPISKAALYSGISTEIIKYGLEHPDYLDCLNFFMHPSNSSEIFREVTLKTWQKYMINSSLEEIKGELKDYIIKCYDEYLSITPFDSINKKSYKLFLESKLPQSRLSLTMKKESGKIHIRSCTSPIIYQNFFTKKSFNYSSFINYLVEHTFEPLSYNSMIELQKNKLAKSFVDLLSKYIEEL